MAFDAILASGLSQLGALRGPEAGAANESGPGSGAAMFAQALARQGTEPLSGSAQSLREVQRSASPPGGSGSIDQVLNYLERFQQQEKRLYTGVSRGPAAEPVGLSQIAGKQPGSGVDYDALQRQALDHFGQVAGFLIQSSTIGNIARSGPSTLNNLLKAG